MATEQKLGIKTFFYYLYRSLAIGIGLLILSLLLPNTNQAFHFIAYGLLILSFLIIVAGAINSWVKYISCTFILSEYALIIKHGLINKKEISIPYRQIQNVNIDQSAANRMMGVSKLIILTAGQESNPRAGESEGVFDVIDASVAKELQENLLRRTNVQQIEQSRQL